MDSLPKIVIVLALGVTSTLAQYTPPSVISALLDKYRSYSNFPTWRRTMKPMP